MLLYEFGFLITNVDANLFKSNNFLSDLLEMAEEIGEASFWVRADMVASAVQRGWCCEWAGSAVIGLFVADRRCGISMGLWCVRGSVGSRVV